MHHMSAISPLSVAHGSSMAAVNHSAQKRNERSPLVRGTRGKEVMDGQVDGARLGLGERAVEREERSSIPRQG